MEEKKFLKDFKSGILWSSAGEIAIFLVSFFFNIVMARLLTPKDFGIIGIATLVTQFANTIFSLGLAVALIQAKEVNKRQISTIFWINLFLSILAAITIYISSREIAIYFNTPQVIKVLKVLSITFLMGGISSIYESLLLKSMSFKKFNIIIFISLFLSAICGIVGVLLGFGYWGLVINILMFPFFKMILYFKFVNWYPEFYLRPKEIGKLFNFGIYKVFYNIVNYFLRNGDNFVVGKYLGSTTLGAYSLAFQISAIPGNKLKAIIGKVMFPLFSKIQDDPQGSKNYFYKISKLTIFITFPLALFLSFESRWIVETLFGKKWILSAHILKFLAFVMIYRAFSSICEVLINSFGRSDIVFYLFTFEGIIFMLSIYLASFKGVVFLSMIYAILIIPLLLIKGIFVHRFIKFSIFYLIKIMGVPFLFSAILFYISSKIDISLSIIFLGISFLFNMFYLKVNPIRFLKEE